MSTGLARSLDRQGRIVIPRELLRAANINPGDLVEIYGDQDSYGRPVLSISKYYARCILCSSELYNNQFKEINGRRVCLGCVASLK